MNNARESLEKSLYVLKFIGEIDVSNEIKEYLSKPEPEPIGWLWQSDDYANRFLQRLFELKDEAEDMKLRHSGAVYPVFINATPPNTAKQIVELEAEVNHWKANHANMVARNARLRNRPDLRLAELKTKLAEAQKLIDEIEGKE